MKCPTTTGAAERIVTDPGLPHPVASRPRIVLVTLLVTAAVLAIPQRDTSASGGATSAAPRTRQPSADLLPGSVVDVEQPVEEMGGHARRQTAVPVIASGSLGSCLDQNATLLAYVAVDESGSLRRTDPEDRRVDALALAVQGLGQVAAGEKSLRVEVSINGFAEAVHPVVGWTDLEAGEAEDVIRRLEEFLTRDRGLDTDIPAVLMHARSSLAERAAAVRADGREACMVLLLFTDGRYDIKARNTGETKPYAPQIPLTGADAAGRIESTGFRAMCRAGGFVDDLRDMDAHIYAIALARDPTVADIPFLEALTGTAEETTCGSRERARTSPGATVRVEDVSQLMAGFFDVVAGIGGGTGLGEKTAKVCPTRPCQEGRVDFPVDPGIRRVNVLALTGGPGIDISLASPEVDRRLRLPNGTSTADELGSATVTNRWVSSDAALISMRFPSESGPWNGDWTAFFVDPTGRSPDLTSRVRVYLFGDIEPTIESRSVEAGAENVIVASLKQGEGPRPPRDLFTEIAVSGAITDPRTGEAEPLRFRETGGEWRAVWTPPLEDFPSRVNVSVTVQPVTRSGIALNEVTRSFALAVTPPRIYPRLEPAALDLGTITGAGTRSVPLRIVGSDRAGGCFWVSEALVRRAPEEAGEVVVRVDPAARGRGQCVRVPRGGSATVEVSVSTSEGADGRVYGEVVATLASDVNPSALRVRIPVEAALVRVVDERRMWLLTLLLLAAGLLLPWFLPTVVGLLSARFPQPDSLRWQMHRARLSETRGGWRLDPVGAEGWFPMRGWRPFEDGGPRRRRRITVVGPSGKPRVELRVRTPVNPLSPLDVYAAPDKGWLVAGLHGGGTRAPLSLGLAGTLLGVVPEDEVAREERTKPSDRPQPDRSSSPDSRSAENATRPSSRRGLEALVLAVVEAESRASRGSALSEAIPELARSLGAVVSSSRASADEERPTQPAAEPPKGVGDAEGATGPVGSFGSEAERHPAGPPPGLLGEGGDRPAGPPPSSWL